MKYKKRTIDHMMSAVIAIATMRDLEEYVAVRRQRRMTIAEARFLRDLDNDVTTRCEKEVKRAMYRMCRVEVICVPASEMS